MSPSPPWRTAFVMTSLITRRRSAIRAAATNGSASAITHSRARGTECGSGATRKVCFSISAVADARCIGAKGYRSRPFVNTGPGDAAAILIGRREHPHDATQRRGRAPRPRGVGRRHRRDGRRDHVDPRHAWFADRPLIDVRLFRTTGFSAAAASTFLLAGALFGGLIVLPLYYQVDRGESALAAGLLMAPQGVGAAFAMPFAGKLTDRIGGGRVSLAGLILVTLSTIPFASISADTSYDVLAPMLVLRGVGIGCAMMPA